MAFPGTPSSSRSIFNFFSVITSPVTLSLACVPRRVDHMGFPAADYILNLRPIDTCGNPLIDAEMAAYIVTEPGCECGAHPESI